MCQVPPGAYAESAMNRVAPYHPTPGSVRQAREHVTVVARGAGASEDTVERARLLTSELTTNAVLHARTPFTVTVTPRGSRLRVAVSDGSPASPAMRPFGPQASTGRGLRLLATLSLAYGIDADVPPTAGTAARVATGKTVWFEVELAPAREGSARNSAGSTMDALMAETFAGIDFLAELGEAGDVVPPQGIS
jgi:Histidine kinase-like ATPase domain